MDLDAILLEHSCLEIPSFVGCGKAMVCCCLCVGLGEALWPLFRPQMKYYSAFGSNSKKTFCVFLVMILRSVSIISNI